MVFVNYAEYLTTEGWRCRSFQAKERAGWRCERCLRRDCEIGLQTHHRTYERVGHERDDDLVVLCEICHPLAHDDDTLPQLCLPFAPHLFDEIVH